MIPFFDPLDERYRYCVYCQADCWPEKENQQHKADCPSVTGLFPVDEVMVQHGAECGYNGGCGYVFKLGDFYMHTEFTENGPDTTVTVACIGCATRESVFPEETPGGTP